MDIVLEVWNIKTGTTIEMIKTFHFGDDECEALGKFIFLCDFFDASEFNTLQFGADHYTWASNKDYNFLLIR